MTSIGERNRRIEVQRRTVARDAANQPYDVWTTFWRPWVKIIGATGMSAVRAAENGQAATKGRYSMRANYKPPGYVDASTDRVLFEGWAFDITDVRPDLENKEHTDIVCEQGAKRG